MTQGKGPGAAPSILMHDAWNETGNQNLTAGPQLPQDKGPRVGQQPSPRCSPLPFRRSPPGQAERVPRPQPPLKPGTSLSPWDRGCT